MRAMKRVLVLTLLAGTALQANTAIHAQTPNTAATIRQYQLERDGKAEWKRAVTLRSSASCV